MTDFRVKFKLTGKAAKTFAKVENKSEFVARAVEWYANFGIDMIGRMDRIESILANGVSIDNKVETRIDPDLENCFDKFVF